MNLSDDYIEIYVYPDGTNFIKEDFSLEELLRLGNGDDCEERLTTSCVTCEEILVVDYNAPFAYCECGTTEWYK